MSDGGEHDLGAMLPDRLGDLVTVGRDYTAVRNLERLHALPYAYNERQTSEEAKGFSREAARTQSGWDHGERLHARRSTGRSGAASITWRNVFGMGARC